MPDINMSVFEEAQRNQLVTEVDIQTQVALDDYQVQLSDIANPTKSQDNVVIDRHGEFLPHWNESLDFDTWVKMSMEVAGKRILILRGDSNVSSASSISDTGMVPSDHFDDSDYSAWTEIGTISTTESGTEVDITPSGTAYIYQAQAASNYIVEAKLKFPSNYYMGIVFKGTASNTFYICRMRADNTIEIYEEPAIGTIASSAETYTANTYYKFVLKVVGTTYTLTVYNMAGTQIGTMSGSDNTLSGTYLGLGGYSNGALNVVGDYIFIRKYTATEPTWAADGGEQNIVVALKSLGRTG